MSTIQNFESIALGESFELAAEEEELRRRAQGGRSAPGQRRHRPPRPRAVWGGGPVSVDGTRPSIASPAQRRCIASCLAPAQASPPAPEPDAGLEPAEPAATSAESCSCPRCSAGGALEAYELTELDTGSRFEVDEAEQGPGSAESPFSEAEELALAAELLEVSSEEELDQFLGKLVGGLKKAGSFIGKVAKPFSGVIKAAAKKALPFLGGALGSLIPVPGVGTALGSALGSAVGNALEAELGGLESDARDFEVARRFVRIAGNAAQQLARNPPGPEPLRDVERAIERAAQRHLPGQARITAAGGDGRWRREGKTIVVHGV